jgi:poly(3-hydroxybutyrate) depolymerase
MLMMLLACTGPSDDGDKDPKGDSIDSEAQSAWPEGLAEPAELSSGECPDMTTSGTTTFTSSGETRKVTLLVPNDVGADSQVVFFFHGLMDPASTPDPTDYLASALNLQQVANEHNAIMILPESPTRTEFGQTFFLWDVEGSSDADIVLFDDLRTCAHQAHGPDMARLSALGFSGGALFTTMIASQRGDTLSTFVEMSGGADLDVLISDSLVAAYETPAWSIPALLWSGGTEDVWPNSSFALVDFAAGTDTLQENLLEDGHFVVRCLHEQGHTITNAEWSSAITWIDGHRFGQGSPFEGDISALPSTCEVAAR